MKSDRIAPPVALAFAWLCLQSDALRALDRTFVSMWLHEAGHAITAWLAGISAFPGPWATSIGETRTLAVSLLIVAGLGLFAWRVRKPWAYGVAGAVFVVQLILSLVRIDRAQTAVLFMGDGGAMVLGALLIGLFLVVRKDLRWGFLILGAFGLMDPLTLWLRARHDYDVIPFGEQSRAGDSDPTRLVDEHGWSVPGLVHRYVVLGVICLLAVGIAYAARWRWARTDED